MKKKIIFLFLFVFILVTFSGCTHIEDTNGAEDYTIETFTDDDIIKKSSYSALGFVETNINGKITIKISKFSGVYEITSLNPKNETLVFTVESKCSLGNFRIVLIKDDAIIRDILINTTEKVEIENANGKYIMKIVGESANFSLTITK